MALRFAGTSSWVIQGDVDKIQEHATATLLTALDRITTLAEPKTFYLGTVNPITCKRVPRDNDDGYKLKVTHPVSQPVEEIVDFQITGHINDNIQKRIVNVIIHSVFYTYLNNRSGTTVEYINGIKLYEATLNDLWQDNDKFRHCLDEIDKSKKEAIV